MKYNKKIVLSSIAVVCLKGTLGNICIPEGGNCTGFFYDDINAAFVDCYDENGGLLSRSENFFTTPLVKECNSTSFVDFKVSLNSTMMYNITNDTSINVCDYFEIGAGYQFTQCDQEIGLVLLSDRVGAEKDLYYQNLTVKGDVLYWDWTELETLVDAYTAKVCPAPSGEVPNPIDVYGPQVWFNLTLPWADWNMTAQEDNDLTQWNKTVWKYWLNNYVTYYGVL